MSFTFAEKYTYQYLSILKKFKGKYDKKNSTWELPLDSKKEFMKEKAEIDYKEKIRAKETWEKACKELGYDFVKKDTEEYDKVKELFKTLIKN
jgi:hypothetical protein